MQPRFLHLNSSNKKDRQLLDRGKNKCAHPEDDIKKPFMEWATLNPVVNKHLYGIEHEGKLPILTAIRHKLLGVKPGIADYLFLYNNGEYPCLWIEFKAGKNTLSDKQKVFKEIAESQGHKHITVWSTEEAITLVEDYIRGES